ncbi:MAG TPA: Hpt domain-containing protein [Caulobacteraceae bacterium]
MNAFEQRMSELRAQFVARLRQDRTELAAAVRDMDRAGIATVAHRLAGGAGIYGLAELGRLAARVEDAAPDAAEDALTGLCRDLETAIDQAR